MRRLVGAGVAPDATPAELPLAAALERVGRLARTRGLVTVVSDFRDDGWQAPLRALAQRHTVTAIEITDPREAELPDVGQLVLVDPETGRTVEADTASPRVRAAFAAAEAERRAGVAAGDPPRPRAPRDAVHRRRLAARARAGAAMTPRRPHLPARAAGDPAGRGRLRGRAQPAAPLRRALPGGGGVRPSRRRPAAAAPRAPAPRCSPPRRRRSRSRSPSRRPRWPCRSRRRRSCSSPTSRARCRPTDVDPSRLAAAQSAAETFLDRVPDKLLVGFVGFSSQTNAVVEPTLDRDEVKRRARRPAGRRRHRDRRRARRGARPPRGAPRQGRQARARRGDPALRRQAHRGQRPARGRAARQAARHPGLDRRARHRRRHGRSGRRARRSPSRPTRETLQEISRITGGTFTEAADAGAARRASTRSSARRSATKRVKREVSSSFAGGGPRPAAGRAGHRPALAPTDRVIRLSRRRGSASSALRASRLAAWSAAETSGQRRSSDLQRLHEHPRDQRLRHPPVVGGDHVPRRPRGRRGGQRVLERADVVVEARPLRDVGGVELPLLAGLVEPREEALLLHRPSRRAGRTSRPSSRCGRGGARTR